MDYRQIQFDNHHKYPPFCDKISLFKLKSDIIVSDYVK